MKYLVRVLLFIEVAGLITGVYLKNTGQEALGTKFIGFSSLGLAFVLMPVFIIYRYRKSDRSKYIFSPTDKNKDLEDFMTK